MPEVKSKSRLGIFFKRGLRALLPTVLTIGVIVIVYNFFDSNIVQPVNDGVKTLLVTTPVGKNILDSVFAIDIEQAKYEDEFGKLDNRKVREDLDKVYPGVFGILVALLLVFTSGFILATFVGKRILGRFESAMGKFPVVKIIYPYARQVVEFFMKEKAVTFNTVVAIEYPRRGLYSLGFVTGSGLQKINEVTGRDYVNVFMPTSPTPVTGYVIFVPASEVIPIPITVDKAVRFLISGGVLLPEDQANPEEILAQYQQIEAPTITQPITLSPDEIESLLDGSEPPPGGQPRRKPDED